ncbi:Myb-like DNA-binding domain protein [Teladorsagia circumcincta]|uniref:Myb-like DNA-binding domain protein n=1 Tax=Teladorsagia circumcincta TaxID=45464 RepID=A0A2G9U027_TELCI|nr:Myb-like DNA-binding domain protein [Teladorsagia circumcincta]
MEEGQIFFIILAEHGGLIEQNLIASATVAIQTKILLHGYFYYLLTVAEDQEMSVDSPGLRIVDEGAGPSDTNSTDVTATTSTEVVHPARKNGFICSQATFADELEALRKISWASTSSSTRSAEEILRKHSMDPDEYLRKASCISDCYYDLPIDTRPKMSDAVPHINIGREYQARVRKWNDRKIHESELEAIEDRDEMVFSPDVLRDIEKDQILKTLCLVEAFELLACSQAIPRPGKNKELALHLLMENKGNIEAAVADLLRSDTLDWEQYQVIYGSSYVDSAAWTPEEVNAFQDAIYKTEKDFHQVAQELPSKTVRECVEFYYTWKKACPDDYRKLRNLRRKRQLLELNLQQSAPRSQPSSGSKKGAQPSADGFFHCRLCDKCFEKVKSLNAHMKSHAMKARAEAEAKAQVDAQLAAQSNAERSDIYIFTAYGISDKALFEIIDNRAQSAVSLYRSFRKMSMMEEASRTSNKRCRTIFLGSANGDHGSYNGTKPQALIQDTIQPPLRLATTIRLTALNNLHYSNSLSATLTVQPQLHLDSTYVVNVFNYEPN